MKAGLAIRCSSCQRYLGHVTVDTAGMEWLEDELKARILEHRKECPYYGREYVSGRKKGHIEAGGYITIPDQEGRSTAVKLEHKEA